LGYGVVESISGLEGRNARSALCRTRKFSMLTSGGGGPTTEVGKEKGGGSTGSARVKGGRRKHVLRTRAEKLRKGGQRKKKVLGGERSEDSFCRAANATLQQTSRYYYREMGTKI